MIRYSSKAVGALAFLKRPYNDVDIFVEDTSNPNMWLYIVRKLLPPKTHITSVIAVGDWRAVVSACRKDRGDATRRKLYIIDGDLQLLVGKRFKLKNLYQLKAYSVENLLLQEEAIIKCASISKPKERERDLAEKFSFDDFMRVQCSLLVPLFVLYAISFKIAPSRATISLGVESLFINTKEGPCICRHKALARMKALRIEILSRCSLAYYKQMRAYISVIVIKLGAYLVVSGKSYLLPLAHKRMSTLFGQKHSYEQWKVQLASYWNGKGEPGLARRISTI